MSNNKKSILSRRNFLRSSAAVVGLAGAIPIRADAAHAPAFLRRGDEGPVNFGLIGFGQWGREIAEQLGKLEGANLVAVADNFDTMLVRAKRQVPNAATTEDYRAVLDNKDVQVVLIATPTHLHRQIAIDALQAGKHVYVEAPMAHTIEDARAMVDAAKAHPEQIFQVGLHSRSEPQHRSIFQFIRSGAVGTPVMVRQQSHNKTSWRQTSATRERERALNWRLDKDVSLGLIGERGSQQLDKAMWFLNEKPIAVTGFGQTVLWKDGREVPDTIQAIFEFPSGVHLIYHSSLGTSFDAEYDLFHGKDSTIMVRDNKAWMFKEVDAPMLGWEVYARKDAFYKERGITLAADATKLAAQEVDPTADDPNAMTPLYWALKDIMDNIHYGPFPANAGYQVGYDAAVAAIKANEAIMGNKKVEFADLMADLG